MNRISRGKGPTNAAHELVAETARGMAKAVYDELCTKSKKFWTDNPSEADFVERTYSSLLGQAREVLAGMLKSPMVDEHQKEQIAEALVLDNTLNRPRLSVSHGSLH